MIFKISNLHKFFFTYICPTFYGGPPAAPSNTTSSVTQNTIPAELMPYALGNLQAAKSQLFKTDASGQITGYQPYKPYSTDPNKYVAGFSALQKQAQQGAGKLAMPGQYGTATGMATEAGQGALGAGDQYNQMATDPGSMSKWMSPYMQNVVDYQTQQANRQYDISSAQQMGGAARAGAFGGSRDAIMAAENARNRNQEITGIQATGAKSAWQDARQAQQFGSTLGMQGYQTAIQGAQELGNLGDQQLAAQTGILNTKNQFGAEQQQRQQALMNQRIKNFENQQNQPYRAMDTMSGLIRGTPFAASATTTNVANPSYAQQFGGMLGAAGSLYGAYKGKAEGGIVGYAGGGSVEGSVEAQLNDMDDERLQETIQTSTSERIVGIAKRILAERSIEGRLRGGITQAYADGGLSEEEVQQREKESGIPYSPIEERAPLAQEVALAKPQYTFKNAEEAQRAIDNPKAPESVKVAAVNALKGIVAGDELANKEVRKGIEGTGLTVPVESNAAPEPEPQSSSGILSAYRQEHEAAPQTQQDVASAGKSEQQLMEEEAAKQQAAGLQTTQEATATERKQIMDERANAGDEQKRQMYLRMAEFFANWGSTPGPPLVAGLKAMKEVIPGVMEDTKAHKAMMRDLNKSENDLNHAVRLEEVGKWDKASAKKEAASARLTKWGDEYAALGVKVAQQQEELAAAQQRTKTSADASMYGSTVSAEARKGTEKLEAQRFVQQAQRSLALKLAEIKSTKTQILKTFIAADKEALKRELKLLQDDARILEDQVNEGLALTRTRESGGSSRGAEQDTPPPEPAFTPPPADDPEAKQKVIAALRAKKLAAQEGG